MLSASDFITRWSSFDVAARAAQLSSGVQVSAGPLHAVAQLLGPAAAAARRLWQRDVTLWSSDQKEQERIAHRLGWLDAPALMAENLERLHRFAGSARQDGFTHAVLLGMGGSSLAPEVLRAVLGPTPGWLQLHVLDSTDPAALLAVETPLRQTLVLVASKSGTTIEPVSLAAAFHHRLVQAGIERPASHFVAITDEGTELAARARHDGYRDLFINPSDIGGRYSALSYFGLVPAALMGLDIAALVGWGLAALAGLAADRSPNDGAVALGAAMAVGARFGRDKMTLLLPPAFEPFGLWVEQLVAESTGKRCRGIVPIAGETTAAASAYGRDRLFVRLCQADDRGLNTSLTKELIDAGHPLIDIAIPSKAALGAEFVRWEAATAIAAALIGINPFDEPNVAQAKEATGALLQTFNASGQLPRRTPDQTTPEGIAFTASRAARNADASGNPASILRLLTPSDYFALLAYLGPADDLARELRALRLMVRDRARVATMVGYGPRYLHSTGQLHKGGADNGVFVLISADPVVDVPIPGERYSFGTLELAQALGDFASLDQAGRRALHVHLPRPDAHLVARVAAALLAHRT